MIDDYDPFEDDDGNAPASAPVETGAGTAWGLAAPGEFAPPTGGPLSMEGYWTPKGELGSRSAIAVFGGGVATALADALRLRRWKLIEAEAPPPFVRKAAARRFGWRDGSARTGPVNTPAHMLQLLREAEGELQPALPAWERQGRWFDSQRPLVEPGGLDAAEDVRRHRRGHLAKLRNALGRTDAVIFAPSRAEAWVHRETGTVFPTAPGKIAGGYDPEVFEPRSWSAAEIEADLADLRARLRRRRPKLRLILAVSAEFPEWSMRASRPDAAAGRERAALSAAIDALSDKHDDVERFPALEMLTGPSAQGLHLDASGFPTPTAAEALGDAFCAPFEGPRKQFQMQRRRSRRRLAA